MPLRIECLSCATKTFVARCLLAIFVPYCLSMGTIFALFSRMVSEFCYLYGHMTAFEAFYHGSWKTVECLQIRAGAKTTLLAGDGHVIKENVPITNLRMRSRKATLSDCTCFLRPGLDVCVLSTCQLTGSSSKEENQEPVSSHFYYMELQNLALNQIVMFDFDLKTFAS